METPSSMRRVTRSQTSVASEKGKQSERSALLDITNDSPIVGLAAEKTPSSFLAKSRGRVKRTPGSGEALLRGQVKTLLQKVEEEGELVNKISLANIPPFRALLGISRSPAQLLAPTPANTPCIVEGNASITQQSVSGLKREENLCPQECLLNRALLFDSPGKSEASEISSSLTYQGSESSYPERSPEDDNSSIWSIQVNASTQGEEDEDNGSELLEYFEEEEVAYYSEEYEEDEESFDDLCDGMMKMSVVGDGKAAVPEFRGKHTRFIYNSDDEIEGHEQVGGNCKVTVSPNTLVLKGLPVPEGKHLRFKEEEEEED
ncbi:uncharacterized protein [Typha angustifolia]|uniref:uncharacterized protein n=1 Tax=Typha angustifolia TaxID=59011 RepID=UPI003C2CA471